MGFRNGGIPTDLSHGRSQNESKNQITYINPVARCNLGRMRSLGIPAEKYAPIDHQNGNTLGHGEATIKSDSTRARASSRGISAKPVSFRKGVTPRSASHVAPGPIRRD